MKNSNLKLTLFSSLDIFSPKKVIFFSGPSLSAREIKKIIPSATVRPPARRGDFIRAVQQGYEVVGLIDGTFIETPTVGAREIKLALEKGLHLYGAASLGALRAVEFRKQGFHGVGVIYNWFLHQATSRDDELIVSMNEENFESLNFPTVNLRNLLLLACRKKIISRSMATLLLQAYSEIHFSKRNLTRFLKSSPLKGRDSEWKKFTRFAHNYVDKEIDLKRDDAINLVNLIQRTYLIK